ncbi:MAG: efflux RND transporter permease subunit [Phycisphaerales bacterium]|nr:efflux RND transporter permease subunit [Phycisphaerales bacterium]
MNAGEVSVRNKRVSFAAMFLLLLGGVMGYMNLGRLEDPEFTIKEALVITPYPGASAEEVAAEVTNPIEIACQSLGQLERVESESTRGRSLVRAVMKDRYNQARIPQVWDELRRKISDAQAQLPPSVRGQSMVVDDFGDVYGVFLAISGEGFTYPELRRYAEFLRRGLIKVGDVKQVELFGEQQETVYLEISRSRLAQLGINEESIYSQLQAKNVISNSGRVRVADRFLPIDPKGGFDSVDDMLEMVIGSDSSGKQLFLKDVATVERGYQDPPRRLLRFDGKPAVGIGISTVKGGNVVTMGKGVRDFLAAQKHEQPLGIEIGEINFQPEAVTVATDAFVFNLFKAVTIVFVVLLIAMGFRAGMIIGGILILTILATILCMYFANILMERISLGAFIIALCMLTDNAIVVTESIKVRVEKGEEKMLVIRESVAQNQWPLLGATAIAVIAFAAIGLSEDATGEYCNSLFWVIFISLALSWVTAITFTPLLCYMFFKPDKAAAERDPYAAAPFRMYRAMLVAALRFRWVTLATVLAMFVAAVYGFGHVKQNFFPPATRPQFLVDAFLPAGTHIRDSEKFAAEIEKYLKTQDGVKHVSTFVGSGGLRFLLVYSPESQNSAFVQFLVNVDDENKIARLVEDVQNHLDEAYPDANVIAKKFLLGPGAGGRVQARLSGPDSGVLRELSRKVREIYKEDGGALCVRDDWAEKVQSIRPELLELQARRSGITRVDVSNALETGLEGRTVGFYREPGEAGGGIFPQETRLLPIVARPPEAERSSVDAIHSMQIWSPVAGRMIPLSQVASGTQTSWEDPAVMRRDRFPTITVHADPRTGLPSQLFARVRDKIEKIELPPGYKLEWGGEYEDSGRARAALAEPLPMALVVMVFIVVTLFNSIRTTMVICLAVPLAIIGVTGGLLLTNSAFGFMALLGAIALGGEQIKNSIVLVDEFRTQMTDNGKHPYEAVVDGSVSRLRPVMLVAITTVLGMIPLLQDPFFSAMAVTIMFGLGFACVLTMIVIPVLFVIFFNVHKGGTAPAPFKADSPAPDSSLAGVDATPA